MAKLIQRPALNSTREGRRVVGGRYRVVKRGDAYLVQKKRWFFWEYCTESIPTGGREPHFIPREFKSLWEAEDFIIADVHKAKQGKESKEIFKIVAEYI